MLGVMPVDAVFRSNVAVQFDFLLLLLLLLLLGLLAFWLLLVDVLLGRCGGFSTLG